MKRFLLLFLVVSYSCGNRKSDTNVIIDNRHNAGNVNNLTPSIIEEYFTDSLNIGRNAFNKIELSRYRTKTDSNYVIIRFYSKRDGLWKLRNEFNFEKDDVAACDTKLSDFNNDGLNDMTYVSSIAGRGANEIRSLFIYDKNMDSLVLMKNSEQYPNMAYNKKLNCIDAFLVYGGCSTVFLKINADSLKEFADVELFHGLTVTVYDNKGKSKVILKDKANKESDVRYKNYKPLEVNNDN